jgi:hypothetical protein
MRPRLVAVFVLLTAMLGSLLTGASAAHALGPSDPVCRDSLDGARDVICSAPPESDGRMIRTIRWTKNDNPIPMTDNIRSIRVSCSAGEIFIIQLAINYVEFEPTVGSSEPIACPKPPEPPRVSMSCEVPTRYVFFCEAFWEGGTDPETVVWNWPGFYDGQHIDTVGNYTTFDGRCSGFGSGPPPRVSVTVTDALGRSTTSPPFGVCQRSFG